MSHQVDVNRIALRDGEYAEHATVGPLLARTRLRCVEDRLDIRQLRCPGSAVLRLALRTDSACREGSPELHIQRCGCRGRGEDGRSAEADRLPQVTADCLQVDEGSWERVA